MPSAAYHTMADLIREAALQEAASRSKTRSPLNHASSSSSSASARPSMEVETENEELFAVYEDEKARNNALARSLDERLEKLARADNKAKAKPQGQDEEKRRLEIEWQQLEYAIAALQEEKLHAPPLDSSAVLDVRTRAELHDLNVQYASALETLRTDLASERDALLREKQLDSDLTIVKAGLDKRLAGLQRKKRADLTSESAVRELSRKFKSEEAQFKALLAQLIDLGANLFGSDNRKVVTLRHYLDEFMNQAWDKPLDPWVSAGTLAQRRKVGEVDDAMIELFIRANIIVAHPKDSRRWRLVAFHKATRTAT